MDRRPAPDARARHRRRASGPLGGVLLVVEHHWTWYRRNWRATAVSSSCSRCCTCSPSASGFGTLIDGTGRAAQATGGVAYLVWLAPALLCVAAVQTAVFESTYPVLVGLQVAAALLAMTATPITPARRGRAPRWMTIKIGGCWRGLRRGDRGVRGRAVAGDRPGAARSRCSPVLRGVGAGHGLHRGRRGRGLGVQRPVPVRADPDDAVLRHVLPDRPAAGWRSAGHLGVARCGTAPSWPGRRRSAAGRPARRSATWRSSLALSWSASAVAVARFRRRLYR